MKIATPTGLLCMQAKCSYVMESRKITLVFKEIKIISKYFFNII